MFIHLGGDVMVQSEQVIAIFDLRTEEASKITAEFLSKAGRNKQTITIDPAETKSFVVTEGKIYYSPISSVTLKKRAAFFTDLD
ncbi:MAG: hypothetical protein JWN30_2399 [Bacilli bacterium]|nr:hypothetical protein [Bacilli bacterium]